MLVSVGQVSFGYLLVPKSLADCLLQPILAGDLAEIVAKLIEKYDRGGVFEIAGPEQYPVKQLIEMIASFRKKKIKFIDMNEKLADFLIGNLVTVLLPDLLNRDQYLLLKEDNISNKNMASAILGRAPGSVLPALGKIFS